MPRVLRVGLGLIVIGFIGSFFVSDLLVAYGGLWYFVIIVSIIMLAAGGVILWVEWGGKKK